ncbi:MAG: NusG domain II-containing protein [Butyricicoccus pullicaecorum]
MCVHTGTLTRAGQMAVCLPTRVVVRLIGEDTTVDAVAR